MKRYKLLFTLLLSLTLLMSMGSVAFAEGGVSYIGGAERFVFVTGSSTGTDLFDGFKNVMPGDEITQQIQIRNYLFGPRVVRLYLRALPHDEQTNPLSPSVAASETVATMSDFLAQLHMEVWQGDRCLFSASPDELNALAYNVPLGAFYRLGGTTLTVKLKVPIELGSEYADRVGEVDWIFTAEEIPYADAPRTGDSNNITLVASVMLTSLVTGFIVFLLITRKKADAK